MNVNVTTENRYVSNIDFVDIDVISEEEAQDLYPNRNPKYRIRIEPSKLTLEGPFIGFFVYAVLTFTGGDLPVGLFFYLPGQSQQWTVHKKNMAYCYIRFSTDEYEEDEVKLKSMLQKWAEKNGIKFER